MDDNRIGKLPISINKVTPSAKDDAKEITKLVKQKGIVCGYQLSNVMIVDKTMAVVLAKDGDIKDVGIATRKGDEYLRALPNEKESNNLSNLPSITE